MRLLKSKSVISSILLGLLWSFFSEQAFAIPSYSLQTLQNTTQDIINEVIETVAVGTAHHAYMPASPMGLLIGLDIGVEVTGLSLPSTFKSNISTLSGQSLSGIPALIPIPKFNVHKGLPFGIDVGFSYIGYKSDLKLLGGDVKWAFFPGDVVLPAAALRLNYTSEQLWYINGTMWQVDVLVSKNLILLEPYLGAGLQRWSGNLSIPTGLPASSGLPANVSSSTSGTNVHFFGGLPIKLGLIHLTAEADYSTASLTTFGAKLSFNL